MALFRAALCPLRVPGPLLPRRRLALLVGWLSLTGPLAATAMAEPLRLLSVTPSGEAHDVHQIVVKLSNPMVGFGAAASAPAPITGDCLHGGRGRWLDTKIWTMDFPQPLETGVTCTLMPAKDLKSLAGDPLENPTQVFTFTTGGPSIIESTPHRWGVPEDAAFVLTLDSDYDPESLRRHAYFTATGIASRIPVTLVTGADRSAILATVLPRTGDPASRDPSRRVIVKPAMRLPSGAKVNLVFDAGVATARGGARQRPQRWAYEVQAAFLVKVNCEREREDADCSPISDLHLNFNAGVPAALASKVRLRVRASAGAEQVLAPKSLPSEQLAYHAVFKGPFAETAALMVELPTDFHDEFGRQPQNFRRFPLSLRTTGYPPLVKFAAPFGIIEAEASPALPVTVRNVEAKLTARIFAGVPRRQDLNPFRRIIDSLSSWVLKRPRTDLSAVLDWLDKLGRTARERSVMEPPADPKQQITANLVARASPGGIAIPLATHSLDRPSGQPFEVMGIPLPGPGFYVIEVESQRLGAALLAKPAPMYVSAGVLVTNLAVHFKRARPAATATSGSDGPTAAKSLVWVTSLDQGQTVAGALVSVRDCSRQVLASGSTDERGMLWVDAPLPSDEELPQCFGDSHLGQGLLVTAEKGADFSFVHSSWNQGIEPWRFNLPASESRGDVALSAVLSRSLLRAGDTLHGKAVVRALTAAGFGAVSQTDLPGKLHIVHDATDQQFSVPLSFDSHGSAVFEWTVPKGAPRGTYRLHGVRGESATAPDQQDGSESWERRLPAGQFRVEEFRVPLAKATIDAGPKIQVRPTALTYDLQVSYLAGGKASGQPVTLRVTAGEEAAPLSFPGFDDFRFLSPKLRTGVLPKVSDRQNSRVLAEQKLTLDKLGAARSVVEPPPPAAVPILVTSELEYRDPAGEIHTQVRRQHLWPARVAIGIRPEGWALSSSAVRATLAAVNREGKPVPGVRVSVAAFSHTYLSHRRRLVGGFYAYDHREEVTAIGAVCSGVTAANGSFLCEGALPAGAPSGRILLEATADIDGQQVTASDSVYVAGKDEWSFAEDNHDRMDVIPELRSYEAGDSARLQVRSPFREATALVTIEREGVLEAFVTKLHAKQPVIDLKIKSNYAPNVYASVLAVRGREGEPKPTFTVDLGKPAFRLGLVPLKVGIRPYQLDVKVSTDQPTYQTRQTVEATIDVKIPSSKDGEQELPKNGEVALAVVDEGLLALFPNDSVQLLSQLTGLRPEAVSTATASLNVVGKRHFGLKAAPAGGGGGFAQFGRQLEDTLIYWNPRIALDSKGRAKVRFPLRDALTSLRLTAVATAGMNRFGTGQTSITSTKEILIMAGVPPEVRTGDRFKASFTIRSTHKSPKQLALTMAAAGVAKAPATAPLELTLASGESREVSFDLEAPKGPGAIKVVVSLADQKAAPGAPPLDQLEVSTKVTAAIPERPIAATLTTVGTGGFLGREEADRSAAGAPMPVALPKAAESGAVSVTLSASLTAAGAGAKSYLAAYPYSCLEQRVSRAIGAGSDAEWSKISADLPTYLDAAGFLRYYPGEGSGSAALTAYVLSVAAASGKSLPASVLDRTTGALKGLVEGHSLPESPLSFGADSALLRLAGLDALARQGKATPALVAQIAPDLASWPTAALLDWLSAITRVKDAARAAQHQQEAMTELRNRLHQRGTTLAFAASDRDNLWWLMGSANVNTTKLLQLAAELDLMKSDLPLLVRGALSQLGRGGHWDLTTANAWGVLALAAASKAMGEGPVTGTTNVAWQGQAGPPFSHDWSASDKSKGGTLVLPWTATDQVLTAHHTGDGHPFALVLAKAALPLKEPVTAGFTIGRRIEVLRRANDATPPGAFRVGDVIKVTLDINAAKDCGMVVVDDPVPAGATILGSGLGGHGEVVASGHGPAAAGAESSDFGAFPVYRETSFLGLKAYYDIVPKGALRLSYTVRLNNAGTFNLPPSRVEAMYEPDAFGELPVAPLTVSE